VKIQDTVRSVQAILDGQGDALPEGAFLYVGTFEDVKVKAETLK
jgi:F0F1-type ATP synthase beta subunit